MEVRYRCRPNEKVGILVYSPDGRELRYFDMLTLIEKPTGGIEVLANDHSLNTHPFLVQTPLYATIREAMAAVAFQTVVRVPLSVRGSR